MNIDYINDKVKRLCTKISKARKKFGDRESKELFSLLHLIDSAKSLNDVKVFRKYRVHALDNKNHNNRKAQVSCAIPSSAYCVILLPLDENGIKWDGEDEINMYKSYKNVKIREVGNYHE